MITKIAKNIAAFSVGILFSLTFVEIIAKVAPATDALPVKKPIKCDENLNKTFEYKLNCFHRREPFSKGIFTQGKFRPKIDISKKTTNNIGQFSDINFLSPIGHSSQRVNFISIGDSYAEALQAENPSTFHGRLNNYLLDGKKISSTTLSASGMALPNYLAYYRYLQANGLNKDDYVVFTIIGNDFDESFLEYGIKGRRGGKGQFFFDKEEGNLIFNQWESVNSLKDNFLNFLLTNFSSARFLVYNLQVTSTLKKLNFFRYNQTPKESNYVANIVNSNESEDRERFMLGKRATDLFLTQLADSMPDNQMRHNIVFVVDCDRRSIHENTPRNPTSFFETMREYFISISRTKGFASIDLCQYFEDDYSKNRIKFNSENDGHWNPYGHYIVANAIARHYKLKPLSK